MLLTVPELGVLLIALFGVFYWLRIFPTVTAVIGFLAIVLLGDTGWLGRLLADTATWVQHLVGIGTVKLIGASAAAVLFVTLVAVAIHDLHPRHKTGRRTAWLGVALGVLIVSGVSGIPALDGVRSTITSAAGGFLTAL